MQAESELLTTTEISRMFKVNRVTVTQWIGAGKLPAIRTLGGYLRVPREDLVQFLQSNRMPFPRELRPVFPAVVVVDDDPDHSLLLRKKILKAHPEWRVETVNNGMDALILIGESKPDILILDIVMPEMDGLEVIRRIKKNPNLHQIKIVACSGHAGKEKSALEAGADAFFSKRGRLEDLVADLPGHLRAPGLVRA